jgi:hypothetical protein
MFLMFIKPQKDRILSMFISDSAKYFHLFDVYRIADESFRCLVSKISKSKNERSKNIEKHQKLWGLVPVCGNLDYKKVWSPKLESLAIQFWTAKIFALQNEIAKSNLTTGVPFPSNL